MIFEPTPLSGSFLITPERLEDERGFFARTFSREEFQARGMNPTVAQCNVSVSRRRGTLRGMHFQRPPFEEAKLVRCSRGAMFDVIIDLRRGSAGFRRHFGVVLRPGDHRMLYVPEGFAHGFLALEDDTEVVYQMSQVYSAPHADGVRWNDPAFAIEWPFEPVVLSERDRAFPDFSAT